MGLPRQRFLVAWRAVYEACSMPQSDASQMEFATFFSERPDPNKTTDKPASASMGSRELAQYQVNFYDMPDDRFAIARYVEDLTYVGVVI